MPAGPVHYAYYKRGYLVIFPSSLLLCIVNWKFGLGALVGYTLGRYIDPDWDLFGSNNAEGRIVNEIFLLGHFIYGISSTYGSFFRRHHRSFWTHFPFVSTAIRLIFIFWVPFFILDARGINFIGHGWWALWLGAYIGLSCADALHFWLDLTRSKIRGTLDA